MSESRTKHNLNILSYLIFKIQNSRKSSQSRQLALGNACCYFLVKQLVSYQNTQFVLRHLQDEGSVLRHLFSWKHFQDKNSVYQSRYNCKCII